MDRDRHMVEVAAAKPSASMASSRDHAPIARESSQSNGKSERDASSSLGNDSKRRKQSHASSSSSSSSQRHSHHPATSSSSSSSLSSSRGATSSGSSNANKTVAAPPPGSSAEERARYELERKKVAKYKEDKLKARRDHTRMILESHAQAKRRALMGKQSEFLTTLEFRNQLPDLPFDTKFLHYPYEKDRLVKYKPNTLEQDYTYEIHEEPNLGLAIDLIDPERYEAPEETIPLEIGDEAALMMKEASAKNQKAKARPAVTWLRRSELMGTDLYNAVHKFRNEIEVQSEIREKNESALAEVIKFTLEDRAEASFQEIQHPNTLVHPFNRNLKIKKCWEVLPDPKLSCNEYAILSYDLLPSSDINKPSMVEKENRALLCGVSKKTQGPEALLGSIMFPTSNDEERDPSSEKFAYFRDYQLAVHKFENRKQPSIHEEAKEGEVKDDSQHCLFLFDPESSYFTYTDISHRVQLKKTKMSGEENRRRGAIVHRRPYSQGEQERRQGVLMEVGAMYHSSLDDKRYRAAARNQHLQSMDDELDQAPSAEEEDAEEEEKEEEEEEADRDEPGSDGEEDQDEKHPTESSKADKAKDSSDKEGLDFGSDSSDNNHQDGSDSPAISSGSDSE